MLKAALEALKRKEAESAVNSTAATQKPKAPAPPKPATAFFDDDEDEAELLDLLDDIDKIGPTLRPTQVNRVPEIVNSGMGLESSFGDISSQLSQLDLFQPPKEPEVESVQTIPTKSRPVIGQTPNPLLPHLIPENCTLPPENRLPFPFPPDHLTPANILRNLQALPIQISQRSKFREIRAIKDRLTKIPLTAGVISKAEQIGKDYLVTLVDEEGGEMEATIHEAAIREHQIKLHTGLLLVLVNLSSFRPTPKHCSLIVVTRNIQTHYNNQFVV
jgi:hypothetical protein